jgi:hypothetical protein
MKIKLAWLQKDRKVMIELYPALIESIIEMYNYIPVVIEVLTGKKAEMRFKGGPVDCLVAKGYQIKYDHVSDFYFCLKRNQSSK